MTSQLFNYESPTCTKCRYFADARQRVPKVLCPACDREVMDVTDSLLRLPIPSSVLDCIPESVARECCVLPFEENLGGTVALADLINMLDIETIEKLRFILNRQLIYYHADGNAIKYAIDRDYGKL